MGTYSNFGMQKLSPRVLASPLADEKLIDRINQRAAYCRFGGFLLGKSNSLLGLAEFAEVVDKTFAVDSCSLHMDQCGELGAAIKSKSGAKVSLKHPDLLFQVEKIDSGFALGVSGEGYKEFSWRERRPRARGFFLPSAIYPKLARLLVNLSHVKEGEVFVDPFCGTASLLIESSLMGMESVGIDLTRWIARGALINMRKYAYGFPGVIRADSTRPLPLVRIDGAATDVPYGRAASTRGKSTAEILEEFTESISEVLRPSRYCVIMHPSNIPLEISNSFQLEEEHLLYVHRNLTRAISVLRRV